MIFLRLFVGYFVQIIPFAILGLYPFSGNFRFSVRKICCITLGLILSLDCIFSGLGYYFSTFITSSDALYSAVNIVFVSSLIPYFLWVLCVSGSSWQKKLFVFSFLLTSAFSMISVCNLMCTWLLRDSEPDGLPYRGMSTLIILIFTVILTPILFLILKKGYMPVAEGLTKKESGYLAVLSLVLFLILASGLLFTNSANFFDPLILFLFFALLSAVFFIYAIFFRMISLSYEKMTARQDSDYLKHQLEIRDEQYHRFNDSIERSRRMHHDLKHHMLTIRGFLNEGKNPEALKYLEHCIRTADDYEIARLCDISVINWIVSYYQTMAKNKGIAFHIRISVPPAKEIAIHDADLAVLLGNLLENAVSAADTAGEEDRFIRLNIAHSGNMLVVTVDNGFLGALNTDGARYLSTKENHTGMGLRSIESIAEKYGGGVEFTHEAAVFHSSVMLNISPNCSEDPG